MLPIHGFMWCGGSVDSKLSVGVLGGSVEQFLFRLYSVCIGKRVDWSCVQGNGKSYQQDCEHCGAD